MKLEITPDKILEAAEKCPQAKETLKTLFPEVFEEDKSVDLSYHALEFSKLGSYPGFLIKQKITKRASFLMESHADDNAQHCIRLSPSFEWKIEKLSNGTYLIPTLKND